MRDVTIETDLAGFPKVSWLERRNIFGPEAGRDARVECRIMRNADNGQLLFVARGSVRHGQFEEGRAWEQLTGFSRERADQRYYSGTVRAVVDLLANRAQASRGLLADTAHVIIAEFGGAARIDINCADASVIELEQLQRTLRQQFVESKPEHMARLRQMKLNWAWPLDDGKVMTYDPTRQGWEASAARWGEAVSITAAALGLIAVMLSLVLWQVGVFSW